MNVQACPTGASKWADSQCHCNWSEQPDGQGGCAPYAITVSSAPPKNKCTAPGVADPIFPLTGAVKEQLDLQLGVPHGDVLHYDTSAAMARDPGSPVSAEVGLDAATMPWNVTGGYWFTSIDKRLVFSPDETNVLIYDGAGAYTVYAKGSGGAYTSSDRSSALVAVSGGYRLYDYRSNTVEVYSGEGVVQTVYTAGGRRWNTALSTPTTDVAIAPGQGYAIAIADDFGRSLNFTHKARPSGVVRLASIAGPTESVVLDYYSNDALKSVSWVQSNTSEVFTYDSTSGWALSSVQDESGVIWLNYGYDPSGRATSQSFNAGIGAYSVSYLDANGLASAPKATVTSSINSSNRIDHGLQWYTPTTVQVHLPNGATSVWNPTTAENYPAPGTSTQPAGAGCAAATSNAAYNSSGDAISRDDFNGNRSCFAYDSSRALRTMALEGRANTQACSFVPSTADVSHPERLTTTAWHPDWSLKVREAQPKKITTWVYNGQPDPIAGGTSACAPASALLPDGKPIAVVCARYEQATTDSTGVQGFAATVTGATRAWTFVYNQAGQVLQETTPKLSAADTMSHTTQYVYYTDTSMNGNVGHTIGDLQSVTNPLLQTTNYTLYDGAGRLLSSTDANSVVTTQTYWPRGWLKTLTVTPPVGAPLQTSYDYWPTGLLKTVTMPDASTLNYAYDGAHRLTDITDAAGNRVHYVLDNDGNRTSEQITDASGNLASTVTRAFDALNRVQSQIGLAH